MTQRQLTKTHPHWWLLTKAGNLKHTVQYIGSSRGLRVCFLSDSVGLNLFLAAWLVWECPSAGLNWLFWEGGAYWIWSVSGTFWCFLRSLSFVLKISCAIWNVSIAGKLLQDSKTLTSSHGLLILNAHFSYIIATATTIHTLYCTILCIYKV